MSGQAISLAPDTSPGGVARRLLRQLPRNPGAGIGAAFVLVVLLASMFAPLLAPTTPDAIDLANRLAPPIWGGGTWDHPFGTDVLGRDVFTRLLYGARTSIVIALLVVLTSSILGTLFGFLAGYLRGWTEVILMRITETMTAFPGLLFAIVIVTLTGPGMTAVVIVIAGLSWMVYAWVTYGVVLSLRETAFVKAAETVGCSPTRIIHKHLFPSLISPLLTLATLEFATVVLAEASLSYIGFGIQPPESSWGLMVAEGQANLSSEPWLVMIPGVAIALLVLSLNLVGGWLRVVSDPQQRARQGFARPASLRRRATADATPIERATVVSSSREAGEPLLAVESLDVTFPTSAGGLAHVVRDVSFEIQPGEMFGIVGESGSGKTMTVRSILRLIAPPGTASATKIRWNWADGDTSRRRIVGDRATMVFQDARASLNPLIPVGRQLVEVLQRHKGMSRREATRRARELFSLVEIAAPERRLSQYPHEFSGGMAQRAAIALALAPEPDLLIADEPTTALDVTIQAQILNVIADMKERFNMAVILVTHDLGVVARMCDHVAVMYAGRIVESGETIDVFAGAGHPYTAALIASTPRLDQPGRGEGIAAMDAAPAAAVPADGCAFAPRCDRSTEKCRAERPLLDSSSDPDHAIACWRPLERAG
jgi:peptide/nickel transport system permease protein